jgi:hypothetical protein
VWVLQHFILSLATSFGKQNGTDFTIGSYVYYKIAKSFAIYLGAEMNYSKYKIETVPEYEAIIKKCQCRKIMRHSPEVTV